jgi:hypothetical protein
VKGPARHFSSAELDAMAEITAEDIERARLRWEWSAEVRALLDAVPEEDAMTDDEGDAMTDDKEQMRQLRVAMEAQFGAAPPGEPGSPDSAMALGELEAVRKALRDLLATVEHRIEVLAAATPVPHAVVVRVPKPEGSTSGMAWQPPRSEVD